MLFYMYLFISVIVVDCIFSINLFLEKKNKNKKKAYLNLMFSLTSTKEGSLISIYIKNVNFDKYKKRNRKIMQKLI